MSDKSKKKNLHCQPNSGLSHKRRLVPYLKPTIRGGIAIARTLIYSYPSNKIHTIYSYRIHSCLGKSAEKKLS
ncbi:hypothetical protein HMPREF1981_03320 [Bacteroides pyogenes F0041]|uniref:Uncharacterized protein n=1 Tax=Bacteroides pyogenes F0041 TaxID=1321819 RepID=U2BSX6_9BACE|nr:hypothetical protein HMPREF1981_03320 [Bacteroides pyogenes F0041]